MSEYTSNTNKMIEAVYNEFEKICMFENIDTIENYIKTFNINVNYNDGYFMEIICERNNLELLKLFIKYGGNVHLNNECLLRIASHRGYIKIIDYLLKECKSNYKVLYESTAYSNISTIKQYIDNYAKTISSF